MHGKVSPNLYHERKLADQAFGGQDFHVPRSERVTVLGLIYVRSRKVFVLSSSDCFLSFFDSGLKKIRGYIRTHAVQVGLRYLESIDKLLTWAAGDDHHRISIWDLSRQVLKYQLAHHSSFIMDLCELAPHELVASSDMDKSLLLWSVSQLLQRRQTGKPEESQSVRSGVLRLRGHTMMIKVLSYAPQHDLLLGAGVEYDAFAWDPGSGELLMTLIGHQHCLCKLSVLYDPAERAITVDVAGNFKVWSIDREMSRSAEVLQSFEAALAVPYKICDMAIAYDDGDVASIKGPLHFSFSQATLSRCSPTGSTSSRTDR